MPIREIHVSGYRSVRDLRLPLRQINILTGPNGSGKSNLYNSVFLLAKAAEGRLARAIAEEGGMPSIMWAGERQTRSASPRKSDPVRVRLSVKTQMYSYELVCGLPRTHGPVVGKSAFDLDPEVKQERVWLETTDREVTFFQRKAGEDWIRDGDGRRTNYSGEMLATESVLSQLREPHSYPELSALRQEMGQWRFYHHFRTDRDSPMRHPQPGVRTLALAHDGRDLAAALQTIEEIGFAEEMREAVSGAFAGASLFISHSNATFEVGLHTRELNRPLTACELSDGTLRYVCLLAALLSPQPPSVLALNEPETSLHPELLNPLAKLMVRAAKNSQLWIVTHSLRLAEFVEKYSGESSIRPESCGGETRVRGQGLLNSSECGEAPI